MSFDDICRAVTMLQRKEIEKLCRTMCDSCQECKPFERECVFQVYYSYNLMKAGVLANGEKR